MRLIGKKLNFLHIKPKIYTVIIIDRGRIGYILVKVQQLISEPKSQNVTRKPKYLSSSKSLTSMEKEVYGKGNQRS